MPGNDDAGRAISLYCDLVARAAIDGISRAQGDSGIDVGASAHPVREEIPAAPQPAGFQGLAGPRGAADDLKKLTGVSGAIEKKFNDLGIFHYWQLAELDHDTAHKIGEEVGLPSSGRWLGGPGQGDDRGSGITSTRWPEPPGQPILNLRSLLTVDGGEAARPRRGRPDRQRTCNNGNNHSGDGQGPARDHGRRHDGLQAALTENGGDMQAAIDWLRKKGLSKAAKKAGRVAAEGLIGALTAGNQGRRRRGQFRDRFRRAQRAVPGTGQDDRAGRARRRRRRREDQGRQGRQRDGRDRDCGRDRDHRRKHDAAPRGFARSRQGRGVELCA